MGAIAIVHRPAGELGGLTFVGSTEISPFLPSASEPVVDVSSIRELAEFQNLNLDRPEDVIPAELLANGQLASRTPSALVAAWPNQVTRALIAGGYKTVADVLSAEWATVFDYLCFEGKNVGAQRMGIFVQSIVERRLGFQMRLESTTE